MSSNSPNKRTNEFVVVVNFLEEFEDSKSPFEIIWPLAILNIFIRLQFAAIFMRDLFYYFEFDESYRENAEK